MGKPTYYNQKDRDLFHEGWFGEAGAAMLAREKDGSLTLGGIHKKQTDPFEPHATRSTMPEGKTPGASSTVAPGRTLLSRPTGQPAMAPTIPKISVNPAATSALTSALTSAETPRATSVTTSATAPITPTAQTTPGASTTPLYLGQPRRTLLSTAPLEDVPGRGVHETQPPAPEPQDKPEQKMGSLSDASAMHIGEESELGRGVGESIKKGFEVGGQSLERGEVNDRIDKIYADKGMGPLPPEQEAELSRLESELASLPGSPEEEGLFAGMFRETLEGLGARQEDFKRSILGQDGSSRLSLEKDPVSKVGEYLFKRIKSDFGGNFRNLSNMKDPDGKPMDENVARVGAVLVTATELAMEAFGGKVLKSIPGADKVKKELVRKVVNAAMDNDKIRAMVVQGSKQLGEGLESVIVEVSKGLTELVTTEASKQVSNANGTEFEGVTGEDVGAKVKQGFAKGLIDAVTKKPKQYLQDRIKKGE